jgi:hypothetical protein
VKLLIIRVDPLHRVISATVENIISIELNLKVIHLRVNPRRNLLRYHRINLNRERMISIIVSGKRRILAI